MGHAAIQQTFDTYGYLLEARDDDRAAMAAVEIGLVTWPVQHNCNASGISADISNS